ncbi:MAG: energy transducer TonB [Bacteroidota bacterium]
MNESSKHKIFNSTDCIPEQMMFDYIDNKLSPKDCHTLEKHLLDCEFCSDALEGLQTVKDRERIGVINQKINELNASSKEKKIIPISYRTVTAIAAGLLLLIGGVFFFNQFASNELMNKKSMADLKEVPASPTPIVMEENAKADSIPIDLSARPKIHHNLQPSTKQQAEQSINITDISDNALASGSASTISETMSEDVVSSDKNVKLDDFKKEEKDTKYKETESRSLPEPMSTNKKNREPGMENYNMAPRSAKSTASEPRYKEKERSEPQDEPYALNTIATDEIQVYPLVDKMPEFPGGQNELLNYVRTKIQFPATDDKGKTYRSVQIQFIISASGKANDPKLLKPQSKALEKQVIEMVSKMPSWKPAQLNGNPMHVKYILPVKVN